MSPPAPSNSWIGRARRWVERLAARLSLRRAPLPGPPEAATTQTPYPDYVTCLYCGEPEVEVWCNEPIARCHNCGKEFEHNAQPECDS